MEKQIALNSFRNKNLQRTLLTVLPNQDCRPCLLYEIQLKRNSQLRVSAGRWSAQNIIAFYVFCHLTN